jgi:hypothetical protein
MLSWIHAAFTFAALVTGGAIALVLLHVYRENRWLAPLFFFTAVACVTCAVPAFFAVGVLT